MDKLNKSQATPRASRRDFLKASAVMTGAAMASGPAISRSAHAAGDDVIKIGLIGCGGRGSGAVVNAMQVDKNIKLTAMADVFDWRIQSSLSSLTKRQEARYDYEKHKGLGSRIDVPPERRFVGFDAYKQLLGSDVDVVFITVPSHFTPIHLKACIDAGKHVFCEKTHAVDANGVKMVMAAGEEARKKNLCVVSGLAWRYHTGIRETMKRVLDGAIGEIVAIQEVCNTGSLRSFPRKPGMTEMEYQVYNWYNFNWLSADLPGLNLVHNLDKGAWAMRDEPPVKAWGMGGREVRDAPRFGDVYDHHATVYEYANGARMYAYCRQQDGCITGISDHFLGTKGRCDLMKHRIKGETNWRYKGPRCNRFNLEQEALFSAIRTGKPINNSVYMARSSMMAIMSTMCSYTGQAITWEQAMNSKQDLKPQRYALDAEPSTKPGPDGRYPIPMPGVTKFI